MNKQLQLLNKRSQLLNKRSQLLNKRSQLLNKQLQLLNKRSQLLNKQSQLLNKQSQLLNKQSQLLNKQLQLLRKLRERASYGERLPFCQGYPSAGSFSTWKAKEFLDAEKAAVCPVKLIRIKIADRAVNNIVRLVLTAILLVLVTACGSIGLLPTSELVQKAIALGLEQTQQKLSQQLDLDFQGFEIKRLAITQEEPLTIENLPAFHVRGTYDLIVKLPKRRLTQPKKPFDVYLQIQQEGKTWRSLIPEKGSKDTQSIWRSYLIQ